MTSDVSSIVITIGSFHLELQQSIVVWLVLCLVAMVFFYFAGRAIDKADPAKYPTGLTYISEEIYNLVVYTIGVNLKEKTDTYVPLFGTVMLMMVVSNMIGLFGVQNPTSNLSFNATLAVTIWLWIQISAIRKGGFGARFKELLEPMPLLLPLNIIGELALPLSLTMRLFGNILAGTVISMLIYGFIKSIAPWGYSLLAVTPFLHMYFDVFSGVIQTYIFFTLSSFFLGQQVSEQED